MKKEVVHYRDRGFLKTVIFYGIAGGIALGIIRVIEVCLTYYK